MMSTAQKFILGLVGLGAGYMVMQNPEAFFRAGQTFERVTAGSIVDVTTGGKGRITQ